MKYDHTQIGYVIIFALIIIIFVFISVVMSFGLEFYSLTTIVLVTLILISFLTLNVTIDNDSLNVKFWYGLYTNSFLLNDIESVKAVKNHWYIWWWIRFWFWPKIVIYNVSWFDAVEIVLKNWKIYRIGTDEPVLLEKALKNAISNLRH